MGRKKTDDGLVALATPQNPVESEMLQDLLRQEQIPVLVRDEAGVGGYMKIYMGYSIYGETLYVHQEDFVRAQELLQSLRQGSEAAILEAQTDACDDADSFEEQQQGLVPQKESAAKEKSMLPGILILAAAIVVALLGMRY